MADIQYWDSILEKEIEEIRALTAEIPAMMDDDEKADALQRAEKKLKHANGTKKTMKLETRLVTDPTERKTYERRLTRLNEDLSHLNADLQALKQDFQRQQLMDGADADDVAEINEEDAQRAGDAMLGQANQLQDKTQESLDYTKQLVSESKEVGLSSLEELKRQRETLNRIDQEADRIDGALDVAEKLIKNFSRRMASDRFIQCFACVNVCLLVGVILYVLLNGGTLSPGGGGEPASPVGDTTTATTGGRFLRFEED
eukprot:CAMPEP_0116544216 /NCGR_PEP_ID=MMETSP0397-20121206/1992_1 /TAXON_ID=216820 /ORGANISM="Cyclophora tenuis, Strain ECT3854" /LENGTH=257 /DNA_ID=CAMNT_0004068399 /DNA_START=28 /DNA_END=801 /DNA_ORIENTATION=-